MCQQAAMCLRVHAVVISLQVQSWAGEVMLLGAVFLTPLDSPEKNPKATFNLWNCTDR